MRDASRKKGITIIETIISIAIFAVIAGVAYQTYVTVHRLTLASDKRDRAVRLAEEGIEAVRSIRDANFASVSTTSTRGIIIGATTTWQFSGTNDVTNGYVRAIQLTRVDADNTIASSTVSWSDRGVTSTVTLGTLLTNWEKNSPASGGLVVSSSSANLSLLSLNTMLTGIYIANDGTFDSLTITQIRVSWTGTSRTLVEIRSPAGILGTGILGTTLFGPTNAASGATSTLTTPITLNSGSGQYIEFLFNGSMVGRTFTIDFILSDGSTKTLIVTNPPTGV